MSLRSVLIVMLALVFGGSVAVGVHLLSSRGVAGTRPQTVSVVVAAVEVRRGATLTADLVKTREWPRELVPAGALTSAEDALDRVTFAALAKDEVLLDGKLTARGAGRGMAALVPAGMRAFTIQTPSLAAGVAGFILPGNKVDVLLTVSDQPGGERTGGGSTTTLLQNVEILAVDQRVDAPAENKVDPKELRSVTLLVTPSQAAKLDLGQNKGTLHLSLRNPEDPEPADTRPVTLADLRFSQEKPWDERARDLLGALGKAMASRPAEKPSPPPTPAAPPAVRIRTLKGTREGVVVLQPEPAAPYSP